MDDDTFLYIITFFVFIGAVALLLIEYVFKKWKCKEGKCEKVFGGDYSTMKECLASKECAKKQVQSSPQGPISGYDCVNKSCVLSDTPKYANMQDCKDECGVPTIVNVAPDYSYGYPYNYGIRSLYPYGVNYGYGRRWWPRRRSPRRRWSPIRFSGRGGRGRGGRGGGP